MISFKFISNLYIRLKFLFIVQNFVNTQIYNSSLSYFYKKNNLFFLFYFSLFYKNYSKLLHDYFVYYYRFHWFKTSLLYFIGIKSLGSFHNMNYYTSSSANYYKNNILNQPKYFSNKFSINQSKTNFFNKIFKSFFYYLLYSPNKLKYSNIIKYLGYLSKPFFYSYLKHLSNKKYKTKNERILRLFLIKNRSNFRHYINNMVFNLFSQLNVDLRVKNLKNKFKKYIFKSLTLNFNFLNYNYKPLNKLGLTNVFLEMDNFYFGLRSKFLKKFKSDQVYSQFRKLKFKSLFKKFNLRLAKKKNLIIKKNYNLNKNYNYKKLNGSTLKLFNNNKGLETKKKVYLVKNLIKVYNNLPLKLFKYKKPYYKFYKSQIKPTWSRLRKIPKSVYKRSYKHLNYFLLVLYLNKLKKVDNLLYFPLTKKNKFKNEQILLNKHVKRLKTKKNASSFSFSLNPEPHLITIFKDIGYNRFLKRYCLGIEKYNYFYRNYYCIYKRKHDSVALKKKNRRYQFKFFHKIKYRTGYRLNTYKFIDRLLWHIKNGKPLPTHIHEGFLPIEVRMKKKAKLKIHLTHTFPNFYKRYRKNCLNDIRFHKGFIKRFIFSNFLTLFTYKNLKSLKLKTKIYFRSYNSSIHWRRIVKYEKSRFIQTVQYLQNRIAYYKNFLNYYSTSLSVFDSSMFVPILRSGKLYAVDKILYKLQLFAFVNNLDIYKYWRKLMFLFDRSYKFNVKNYGRRRVLKKTIVPAFAVPLPTRLHALYNDVFYLKEINSVNKFLRFIFQMKKTSELQYYKSACISLDMDFDYISVYRKDQFRRNQLTKVKNSDKSKHLSR